MFHIFIKKNMIQYIELECQTCKNKFNRRIKLHNQLVKKNTNSYCSKECSGKKESYDISKHCANNADEFSNFRYIYKILKGRMHQRECNVTLQDLKDLWELQKGICPYSGIQLKLIKHTNKFADISEKRFEIASLDRIDSSKGYIKGNLCFVSMVVNFMKNNLPVEHIVEFMYILSNNIKNRNSKDLIDKVNSLTKLSVN